MPTTPEAGRDKVTVGLTSEGTLNLEKLFATGWFSNDIDAYRLAISVALARGIVANESSMAGLKTKYNVGSLDPDGTIRNLVSLVSPQAAARPYEHAERRAQAGLEFLARKVADEGYLLSEVLLGEEDSHDHPADAPQER